MNVEFPEVTSVLLGPETLEFRRLCTNGELDRSIFPRTRERREPYCLVRQYLQLMNDQGFCPFTPMLERENGYFVRIMYSLPTKEQLYALARHQEAATERLVQLHDLQEVMSVPPITTVVAFAHKKARRRSFFTLLEEMRKAIRVDMIPRKRAVAIAHPLHPLGSNANGTQKRSELQKPFFISPIPLMDMRYLHPMDGNFDYTPEERLLFEKVLPLQVLERGLPMSRKLPYSYLAENMDRGMGMTFHPCSRTVNHREMHGFTYDARSKTHYFVSHWPPANGRCYRDRIGTGEDFKSGDAYPDHWIQDPWTGENL